MTAGYGLHRERVFSMLIPLMNGGYAVASHVQKVLLDTDGTWILRFPDGTSERTTMLGDKIFEYFRPDRYSGMAPDAVVVVP